MQILRDYAFQLVGVPYRWGGDDPLKGFDCSGLVIELLQSCGVLPPRFDTTAQGLHDLFLTKGVISGVGFGALAFFGKSSSRISHVGFMLDHKRMIEAGGGGSATIDLDSAANANAYVRIRPIAARSDLVASIKPRYNLAWQKGGF